VLSPAGVATPPGGRDGVFRNQRITIDGSRIAVIAAGHGTATYDLRGLTVMPGWIDTHVDLNWHYDANHKYVAGRDKPEEAALFTAEKRLAHATGRVYHRAKRRCRD
jgi:imidazolonepropionase-like amidohydrolase